MSPKEKRNANISLKVNESERETIKRKATECGLNTSQYLRIVGCGHRPHSVLTDEEKEAFALLDGARNDIIKFGNALRGLDSRQRTILFQTTDKMNEWVDIIIDLAGRIKKFFNKIERREV